MDESLQQVWQKVTHYCAYQERCHAEVREKLFSFHLKGREVETLIAKLIEENYLNEQRFATAFAGGKFRIKHWGKQKIRLGLKQKRVSEYCIRKALDAIDNSAYQRTFARLAEKKLQLLKSEKNIFIKKRKLRDHLLQKGYESALITEWFKNI
ncbi:MAG TPA: regulatory protein RecX [Parafilimonas sp.]|nr:regulatory protein RecX [Parafilimonas sp.]